MRLLLLGCAVIWMAMSTSELEAAQRAKGPRTVQIISMGQIPSRPPVAEPAAPPGNSSAAAASPKSADDQALSAAFRTHDLSRRWVAFEMADSFAGAAATPADSGSAAADPFAPAGAADLGQGWGPASLRPPPGVVIPGWMRAGQGFSPAPSRFAPGCAAEGYRPSGFLEADAENRRLAYYAMMRSVACDYRIPVGLFDALIIRESRYKTDIFSPKNAFGLTQLMPETAAGMGVNRFDVEQNLRGGARYLRQQLDRFGQVHLALAAYNAGPGRVRNGVLPRIAETQAYVDRVLLDWQRLAGLTRTGTVQSASSSAPRRVQGSRGATVSSF